MAEAGLGGTAAGVVAAGTAAVGAVGERFDCMGEVGLGEIGGAVGVGSGGGGRGSGGGGNGDGHERRPGRAVWSG